MLRVVSKRENREDAATRFSGGWRLFLMGWVQGSISPPFLGLAGGAVRLSKAAARPSFFSATAHLCCSSVPCFYVFLSFCLFFFECISTAFNCTSCLAVPFTLRSLACSPRQKPNAATAQSPYFSSIIAASVAGLKARPPH